MIKSIYEKPTANIILNVKKLEVPTYIRTKARISILLLDFNIVLEVLSNEIRQEKEIKGIYIYIYIKKEEIKLFLFTDDIIINVENLK